MARKERPRQEMYSELAVRSAMQRAGVDAGLADRVLDALKPGRARPGEKVRPGDALVIEVDGVSRTIAQWAEFLGCSPWTIRSRIGLGWDPVDAVTIVPRSYKQRRS